MVYRNRHRTIPSRASIYHTTGPHGSKVRTAPSVHVGTYWKCAPKRDKTRLSRTSLRHPIFIFLLTTPTESFSIVFNNNKYLVRPAWFGVSRPVAVKVGSNPSFLDLKAPYAKSHIFLGATPQGGFYEIRIHGIDQSRADHCHSWDTFRFGLPVVHALPIFPGDRK